ncbi:MAG: hypothetical protein ACREMO_14085, partial [Gemmatimonadales bacterium]
MGAFSSAAPFRGRAAALWHPARAWEATIAPVRIRVVAPVVERGALAAVELEALGRRRAILWTRAPGETWRGRAIRLDTLGRATELVGPLESDLFVRLTSGSRGSDTALIRVRIPAFLGSLTVTAHYPRYLALTDEPIPIGGDTVLLPAGTRLETQGEATTPLRSAEWVGPGGSTPLEVASGGFSGGLVPRASGAYRLSLATVSGVPLAGDTVQLPLRVVPDSAPGVDVPVPGVDTIAPLDLHLPLVIDVRDDHGVARVWVESRRISRLGFTDPGREETVPLPGPHPDRAILTYDLNLNQRNLLPGDTVRYRVWAMDNSPGPNHGHSREFVLRLPTLTEVRAAARQASEAVGRRLDSVTAESRRLERQTEDLAQEQAHRDAGSRGRDKEALSFEAAKRAEAVAGSQEQVLAEAEAIKKSLEALQQSAEAAGLNDPAWQQRLQEIREQIERALTPELRERLAELQKALKALDPERAKQALSQLAEAQKQLREALERSRELFRRAALEGELANLASEAKELVRQQEDWTNQVASADSARAASQEQELAARADSLSTALERIAQELAPEGRQEKLDSS